MRFTYSFAMANQPQNEKKAIDWERIEIEYRAGVLSVREIAATCGVSHTAIQKRSKAQGWNRDLNAKIKAKADALVAKAEVANKVATEKSATDQQVIEANAQAIVSIRLAHRSDISRSRTMVVSLLTELEGQTEDRGLFEAFGEMMRSENRWGADKLNDLYHKIISLPGRVDSIKKLSDALKTLIGLEREAYGIESTDKAADTIPSSLAHFYPDD